MKHTLTLDWGSVLNSDGKVKSRGGDSESRHPQISRMYFLSLRCALGPAGASGQSWAGMGRLQAGAFKSWCKLWSLSPLGRGIGGWAGGGELRVGGQDTQESSRCDQGTE